MIMLQIRYGRLAVLPDLESLTAEKVESLSKVIKTAKDADTGKSTDGEPVNVLHVALMKVRASSLGCFFTITEMV